MRKIICKILLLFTASLLSACSSMNSKLDCPNKAGVQCKSLDQINQMVDRGEIRSHLSANAEARDSVSYEKDEFKKYSTDSLITSGSPTRYRETVQRIWIAPFEDTENNYHDEHYMYTVMKSGHWSGDPVKTVHSNE